MNVEEVRTTWIGRRIDGRFPLDQFLGGSDESAVFLTELPGDEPRKAAIKLVPAEGDEADKRLGAWALARAFSDPNLLRIMHSGSAIVDGTRCVYVVSECADEVLSEIIPARPLTIDETRQMLGPVSEVLAWLHSSGFVHGHIRPSNIFVIGDEIKLSADGLLAAGTMRSMNAPQTMYDAPETKNAPLAPANDLWSLGVTLVETLTQHQPEWDRTTSAEPLVPDTLTQPFADIARGCLRPIPTYRIPLSEVINRLARLNALSPRPAENREQRGAVQAEEPVKPAPRIQEPEEPAPKVEEPVRPISEPEPTKRREDVPVKTAPQAAAPAPVPVQAAPEIAVPEPVAPDSAVPDPVEPDPVLLEPVAAEEISTRTRSFQPEERRRIPYVPLVGVFVLLLLLLAFVHFHNAGGSAPAQSQNQPAPGAPESQAKPAPAPPSGGADSAGSGASGAVAQRVMPKVLASAQSTIHGTLKLSVRVSVDATGKVTDASLTNAGPSRYFDRVALDASRSWQFTPPRPGGQPVASTWLLHYQFRHDSIECDPQQVAP